MSLISKTTAETHRTNVTSADSGNVPSAWSDTPTSFGGMSSSQVLRVYPILNSGSFTTLGVQVIVINGSNTYVSSEVTISDSSSEIIDFREGYEGESQVYVKISTLDGSSPDISLEVVGVNVR